MGPDNIAAAVLRHAEFPEVRQSQKKKHLSLSNSTTVSDLGFIGQTMN